MTYFHTNDYEKSKASFIKAKKYKKCEFDVTDKIDINIKQLEALVKIQNKEKNKKSKK